MPRLTIPCTVCAAAKAELATEACQFTIVNQARGRQLDCRMQQGLVPRLTRKVAENPSGGSWSQYGDPVILPASGWGHGYHFGHRRSRAEGPQKDYPYSDERANVASVHESCGEESAVKVRHIVLVTRSGSHKTMPSHVDIVVADRLSMEKNPKFCLETRTQVSGLHDVLVRMPHLQDRFLPDPC